MTRTARHAHPVAGAAPGEDPWPQDTIDRVSADLDAMATETAALADQDARHRELIQNALGKAAA